jgi:molybdopterin converting factor small subunit
MARLRLFAQAREAAGRGADDVPGATVGEVLQAACARYGESFSRVLEASAVWVNGDAAHASDAIGDLDELAVLPPVSGGL